MQKEATSWVMNRLMILFPDQKHQPCPMPHEHDPIHRPSSQRLLWQLIFEKTQEYKECMGWSWTTITSAKSAASEVIQSWACSWPRLHIVQLGYNTTENACIERIRIKKWSKMAAIQQFELDILNHVKYREFARRYWVRDPWAHTGKYP